MMKQIASVFLIVIILLQAFGSTIVLSNYYINKDYITSVFCINKDKPKLKCNGKCHLKKQLKKTEENEKAPLNSAIEKSTIELFSTQLFDYVFNAAECSCETAFCIYTVPFYERHLTAVFHPPQTI